MNVVLTLIIFGEGEQQCSPLKWTGILNYRNGVVLLMSLISGVESQLFIVLCLVSKRKWLRVIQTHYDWILDAFDALSLFILAILTRNVSHHNPIAINLY